MKWFLVLATVVGLGACTDDSDTAAQAHQAAQQPSNRPVRSTAPAPNPVPARQPDVDLLRAVATDIVVSSVYRNDLQQAAQLADADLQTAWNARSGELLDSWIEVHLPSDATVTSLQITAGFTHRTATADLFTGNQRIARVRVRHNNSELGVFSIDPESRELQTLPVHGAGGVYRVEVLELVAGSHANWREVCVSELRVLGQAPTAIAGRRFPHFHVGARTPRETLIAPDNVEQHFVRAADSFARAFRRLEGDIHRDENDMGEPGLDDGFAADYRRRRRQLLQSLGSAIEAISAPDGDSIRALAFAPLRPGRSCHCCQCTRLRIRLALTGGALPVALRSHRHSSLTRRGKRCGPA
jgi:hypothetical protein